MTSCATQVKETTFSENEHTVTIGELPAIELRLDILALDAWVVFETSHVDLVIEVANVTNNSIVLHLSHMLNHDDVFVSSCSNEDISLLNHRFDPLNLKSFHKSL
jgi:hypothetical protein